jgi:hypothetical protein
MVLLVDAGNSRLKWSELDTAGNLSTQQAWAYGDRPALSRFFRFTGCLSAGGTYHVGACFNALVC